MNVKTRFAPSPTGSLHVGNVRTALYSWLFARSKGGQFILRIEDTNCNYNTNNLSIENIITTMKWLNLNWDEGPYFQSHRLNRYRSIINDMLKKKIAYKCYCSQERLEILRLNQIKNKEKPKYDGYCRIRAMSSHNSLNNSSFPYVIRFCNPKNGQIKFYDQIRGTITFDNKELDDLIICRANGVPTYNFCVVIDDIDMKITHIIRGVEHINNTPRQINIIKSLKASVPIYAHVPMILDIDQKKLSKRDKNSGILQYRDEGFLPEAMLNYLIRLGWSHGNQEIFSIEQMKKYFCLNKISKSSSIFNFERLLWLNRYYIKNLPINHVAKYLLLYMNKQGINYENQVKLNDIVKLFSKRCNTLQEMAHNYINLYKDFNISEKKISKKYLISNMYAPLKFFRDKLNNINHWTSTAICNVIKETILEFNINMNSIGMAIRVALTGTNISPEINTVIYVLGKKSVLNRIDQAIFFCKK